jgi:hypothetical protein
MPHAPLTPNRVQNKRPRARTVRTLSLASLTALAIASIADAATIPHRILLNSTVFASRIGSTPGGTVYAGAVVDSQLHHGAIVYSSSGATSVRVMFHEFFALGSIGGSGHVTVSADTRSRPMAITGTASTWR